MKNLSRFLVIGMLIVVISMLIAPVAAQDDPEGAGEGGVIFASSFGDDPSTFNPLIGADTSSSEIYGWIYPGIVGINPENGNIEPNQSQALATSWEYDETGTILTVHLREDATWNDGTPITSADYLWAVNAVRSGVTSSPRTSMFATLSDGSTSSGKVTDVVAIDDYTVQITFTEPDCIAFNDINDVTVVPAHIWEGLYGDDYAKMDEDPRAIPTVTFGPFKDIEFAPGQRVSLLADQAYPDTQLGYVSPSEWVRLSVPDQTVQVERFIAGDISYLSVPSARQGEFRGNADFQVYETSQNGFQYMGYNLANPENPQPGVDEDGNIVEQEPHPIFADVLVRQALAHAVDVDAMIDGILDGNGIRAVTHTIPTSWAQAALDPYEFNPDMAKEMLAEAGWTDEDGDGTIECHGCWYAENVDSSYEGTPFSFVLETNAGNVAREAIGETIQSQLGDIGVDVDFQAIDFGVLVDKAQGQTFDAIIIGWSLGLPIDPDVTSFYTAESDAPGSAFGFTSYYNAELEQLLKDARNPSLTNNCDTAARAEIYEQIQTILYNDQPYMYLYVGNVMTAAQANVEGFNPYPFSTTWNIDAWSANE